MQYVNYVYIHDILYTYVIITNLLLMCLSIEERLVKHKYFPSSSCRDYIYECFFQKNVLHFPTTPTTMQLFGWRQF